MAWGRHPTGQSSWRRKALARRHSRGRSLQKIGLAHRARCRSGERVARTCSYNAGGALPTLRTGLELLRGLPSVAWPAVLLLGVDYGHMAVGARDSHAEAHARALSGLTPIQRADLEPAPALTSLGAIGHSPELRRAFLGLAPPPRIGELHPVGVAARAYGAGFRPDGSYYYGPERYHPTAVGEQTRAAEELSRIAEELSRIAAHCCLFESFEQPADYAANDLRALLRLAQEHGTKVIGFTPPLMPSVVAALDGLAVPLTFLAVLHGWVLFRAQSFTVFGRVLERMYVWQRGAQRLRYVGDLQFLVIGVTMMAGMAVAEYYPAFALRTRRWGVLPGVIAGLIAAAIFYTAPRAGRLFIYFQL